MDGVGRVVAEIPRTVPLAGALGVFSISTGVVPPEFVAPGSSLQRLDGRAIWLGNNRLTLKATAAMTGGLLRFRCGDRDIAAAPVAFDHEEGLVVSAVDVERR